MHPILADKVRLGFYLAIWLLIGLVLAALLQVMTPRPVIWLVAFAAPMVILYAFVCLSAWWVCRAVPLGRSAPRDVFITVIGAALASASMWVAVGAGWADFLAGPTRIRLPERAHVQDAVLVGLAGMGLYLLSVAVHYLLLIFEASREADRRTYELLVSAREAELRALRAQLNPHFLFNSLNSINAFIGSSPEAARRMCEGLGDFLRRTLKLGARDSVTLAEELTLVERYLAIEAIRFGSRLTVEKDTEPAAEACLVPPLLLQPLVENAVKHGVAERLEGGVIHIGARRRNGELEIEVVNPFDEDSPSRRGEGVGLANVRRRLDALASREARLVIDSRDGLFRARLNLPAVEPPPPAGG